MKLCVITGGPSVGKTTVLEILATRGYAIVHESARAIIEEENTRGSDIVPWKNLALFQDKVIERQLKAENSLGNDVAVAFLDRGIIDGYAYCMLGNIPAPEMLALHAKGRYAKIFVLDPLPTFVNDNARVETKEMGLKIHTEIQKAYETFGYAPIIVPVLPAHERVDFILKNL